MSTFAHDEAVSLGEQRPESQKSPEASVGKRMLAALLDPRAIQWLFLLGGTLSVIGLIVWLVSVGVFDRPLNQAIGFGMGTIALFASGWWLALRTRYRLAGEAVTFLACVVAPLNLWFYDSQGLLEVDDQLWIAGLACTSLYAGTLFVLRKPVFVYAFQTGVTLTVLLMLANLGELGVQTLSIALASLGFIAVHLERTFPPSGEFDRKRFGTPFVWGGLALALAAGAVVLPAQLFAWSDLPGHVMSRWIDLERVRISPTVAACIWLAASYAAMYAAVIPRIAGGWTGLAAVACLLMAETTVLIGANATAEGAVVAMSLTAAVASAIVGRLGRDGESRVIQVSLITTILLSAVPIGFGYLLFARGAMPSFKEFGWERAIDGAFPLAMTLAAACLVASTISLRRYRREAAILRFFTAGAILLAASGAVRLVDLSWSIRAAILTLIPLTYLIEGMLRKDDTDVAIAHTAFGFFGLSMFLAVCHQGLQLFIPEPWKIATLGTTIVALEAMAFLLMTAARFEAAKNNGLSIGTTLLATAGLAIGLWQGLGFVGAAPGTLIPTFVATALLPLLASRGNRITYASRPMLVVGTSLLFATLGAADLRALGLLANVNLAWRHFGELAAVVVAALAAGLRTRGTGWSRVFVVAAALSSAVATLVLSSLVNLSGWQRIEVLCVTMGLVVLAVGHIARFREQGKQDDLTDAGLWSGSLFALVPLVIAMFYHRFGTPTPSLVDELVLVTLGLLMLATGLAWRMRATTLLGGGALGGYLLVLLISLFRQPEVTMGAYLTGAGAALFLLGVALSIYRDRLLILPERIARREGVFQVLSWR